MFISFDLALLQIIILWLKKNGAGFCALIGKDIHELLQVGKKTYCRTLHIIFYLFNKAVCIIVPYNCVCVCVLYMYMWVYCV